MADKEYLLKWIIDPSAAVSGADQITRSLLALEAVIDRVGPKLKTMANGATRPMNNAGKATTALTGQLQALAAQATTAATKLNATGSAAQGLNAHLGRARGGSQSLGASLAGLGAGALALNTLRQAARGLAEALKEARDFAHETAQENLKLRDSVRELRAIKGDGTTTDQATQSVVDLMLKTGMSESEAVGFETMWNSTLPAAKANKTWKLNDQQTEEVRVAAARFAVANDISPETMGRLVPSIGIGQEMNTSDQVLGELAAMHKMGVESVGKFTPMMKAESKLVGSMVRPEGGGAVKSSAELQAVLAAASITSGGEARTVQHVNQVWRELSAPKTAAAQAKFKDVLGIEPGKDDYVSSIRKVSNYLEKTRAEGKNDQMALREVGLKANYANTAIISEVKTVDALEKMVGSVAAARDPKAIGKMNDDFDRDNPDRKAKAREYAARQQRGTETRDLEVARRLAIAAAVSAKRLETPESNLAEWAHDMIPGGQSYFMQEPARLKAADIMVTKKILDVVPHAQERFPDLHAGPAFVSTPARGQRLAEIMNKLKPEEREKVMAGLQKMADDERIKAERAGGGEAPAAKAAGPGKVAPGGPGVPGPGASIGQDGKALLDVNQRQLVALNNIAQAISANRPRGGVGPLHPDAPDDYPVRRGS